MVNVSGGTPVKHGDRVLVLLAGCFSRLQSAIIVSRFSCAISTSSFDASLLERGFAPSTESAVDVLLFLQRMRVEVGLRSWK